MLGNRVLDLGTDSVALIVGLTVLLNLVRWLF